MQQRADIVLIGIKGEFKDHDIAALGVMAFHQDFRVKEYANRKQTYLQK